MTREQIEHAIKCCNPYGENCGECPFHDFPLGRCFEVFAKTAFNMLLEDRELLQKQVNEYKAKIEHGTLIEFNMKMPFKVGGMAYWLNGLPNCIQEYKVLGYIFDYSSGVRVDLGDFKPILFRVFGEKLFSSREKAEAKLKELENANADDNL